MGDFNVVRKFEEKHDGIYNDSMSEDSIRCVIKLILMIEKLVGVILLRVIRVKEIEKILCKLNQTLINDVWLNYFVGSIVVFELPSIPNHYACHVISNDKTLPKNIPFKFFNMWASHDQFLLLVRDVWGYKVKSSLMFRLITKLKMLKPKLKELNKVHFGKMSKRVHIARKELFKTQK